MGPDEKDIEQKVSDKLLHADPKESFLQLKLDDMAQLAVYFSKQREELLTKNEELCTVIDLLLENEKRKKAEIVELKRYIDDLENELTSSKALLVEAKREIFPARIKYTKEIKKQKSESNLEPCRKTHVLLEEKANSFRINGITKKIHLRYALAGKTMIDKSALHSR